MVLLCFCASSWAATLPTDLEPLISADNQPADSDERAIWQKLARVEESIRGSPQRLIAPDLEDYTRDIIERLLGEPAPYLRIYLVHDDSLNAAMLPSGMMIVNTGLLARVRNEAQLAAVLGHEAGHYFRRHALDLNRNEHRRAALSSTASTALLTYNDSFGAWNQINQAILMSSFKFSRDLESEADAYGLMLMARAGYPPTAAAAVWRQLVEERRASADARQKRYRDETISLLSTHPPTDRRMGNLVDTAGILVAKQPPGLGDGREHWADVIGPYQPMLLHEQVYRNDAGASLYLLENLAKDGWSGVLRFYEGEVHRLRNAGDARAAGAYAGAVALPDAPPEAWRAHGFALLEAGKAAEAQQALTRYLAMKADAPDVAMIRLALAAPAAPEASTEPGEMPRPASPWKKLPSSANATRWERVWTWNGPQLDRVAVISGLPDGKAIATQPMNTLHEIPPFHARMTAQDLASMLEVSYRVNGVTVFHFASIEPVAFLGGSGVRMRYDYVSGIGITKKGDCVMRVIDRKLYAMKLESLADRYYDSVAPEFEQLVTSLRRPPE